MQRWPVEGLIAPAGGASGGCAHARRAGPGTACPRVRPRDRADRVGPEPRRASPRTRWASCSPSLPRPSASTSASLRSRKQNIRGGLAYLRWLLAYFEGDIALAAAAYNAGEGRSTAIGGAAVSRDACPTWERILRRRSGSLSLRQPRIPQPDVAQAPPRPGRGTRVMNPRPETRARRRPLACALALPPRSPWPRSHVPSWRPRWRASSPRSSPSVPIQRIMQPGLPVPWYRLCGRRRHAGRHQRPCPARRDRRREDGRGHRATGDDLTGAVRPVKVVATERAQDLALLRLEGGPPLPALRLAGGAAWSRARVAFTGFPIGAVLGMTR